MTEVLSTSEIQKDVDAFNDVYGEMDRVLWCLARYARVDLLRGQNPAVVVELVRTIKDWWGVTYTVPTIEDITAAALTGQAWSEDLFNDEFDRSGERFAVDRVEQLVEDMFKGGSGRREWSLASKALHWLMPWRVPVYDSYVRKTLGIAEPLDPNAAGRAYGEIVRQEFRTARRHASADPRWLGEIEPRTPIRACDRSFWWRGGGNKCTARRETDPWKVIRALGLKPC